MSARPGFTPAVGGYSMLQTSDHTFEETPAPEQPPHGSGVDFVFPDFRRPSELQAAAFEAKVRLDERHINFLDKDQEIRERDAAADIETRRFVLVFAQLFLLLLVLLGFVAFMWGPESGAVRVLGAALFIRPIPVLAAIVLLRGRITKYERDVIARCYPEWRGGETRSRRTPVRAGAKRCPRAMPE